MRAAWYERPGPAAEVLQIGEMEVPEPGSGGVLVRVAVSGVNPGDTKKRGDWLDHGMPFPRIVPHSDGAGVMKRVGEGVESARVGERVWLYGAQSYRASGPLRSSLWFVPSRRSRFPPGSATRWGRAPASPESPLIARSSPTGRSQTRRSWSTASRSPCPTTRTWTAEVIGLDGIIAAYASRHDRPAIPFWPMLFANVTLRLIGSDDFPLTAKRDAANDLTTAAGEGARSIAISDPLPLERIAEAHDRVDAGTRRRILLTLR